MPRPRRRTRVQEREPRESLREMRERMQPAVLRELTRLEGIERERQPAAEWAADRDENPPDARSVAAPED